MLFNNLQMKMEDVENYEEIEWKTNVHRRCYRPNTQIKTRNNIRNLMEVYDNKIDYVQWNDTNFFRVYLY